MSGGKGGSQTTQVPRWVQQPAERNLARAEDAAGIGYTPYYGPSLAPFNDMQRQAFDGAQSAGAAFGLAPQGPAPMPAMPAMQDFGGMNAFSSGPLYDLAMAEFAARRPGQAGAIDGMFIDPFTGGTMAPPAPKPASPSAFRGWSGVHEDEAPPGTPVLPFGRSY